MSRSGRAHCSYAFGLHALRACYPRFGLDRHAPGSGHYVSECPAPWTCAAAAGPTVLAPSVCVLRVLVTLVPVPAGTHLIKGAVLQGAMLVPQLPSTRVATDTMHWVYQIDASTAGDSHIPAASTSTYNHFFPGRKYQSVECCSVGYWLWMCQCQCSGYRAVQSRARKTQVVHSNFCFAG